MVLNIENIDVAMSSFEQPKLTSKMLYHQNLDLKKKIHFNTITPFSKQNNILQLCKHAQRKLQVICYHFHQVYFSKVKNENVNLNEHRIENVTRKQ